MRVLQAVLITVAIALVVIAIVIYVFRRRYSQGRFAFFAFGALVTLFASYVSSLYTGQFVWAGLDAIARRVGLTIESREPTGIEQLSVFLGFVILALLAGWIFRSWSLREGHLTANERSAIIGQAHLSLPTAALMEIARIVGRGEGADQPTIDVSDTSGPGDLASSPRASFRYRALELVRLTNSSLDFATASDNEWDDNIQAWVGVDKPSGQTVLVLPREGKADYAAIGATCREAPYPNLLRSIVVNRVDGGASSQDEMVVAKDVPTLLDEIANLDDYRHRVRAHVTRKRLPGSLLTLRDVYVNPTLLDAEGKESDLRSIVSDWVRSDSSEQLALLGGFGRGKSSAAIKFAFEALDDPSLAAGRIPIVVELRGLSPRDLDPAQLLAAWATDLDIHPRALFELHLAGRLLIIFDGFDEMALVGDQRLRLNHFRSLWRFAHQDAKIIFTGRPNFFFDTAELESALRTVSMLNAEHRCVVYRLAPFDLEQARQALQPYDDGAATDLADLMSADEQLGDLLARPSMLHVAGLLWERGKIDRDSLDLGSYEIMNLFVESQYTRQQDKVEDGRDFMLLSSPERGFFMRAVAVYMVRFRLPNQIGSNDLKDLVRELALAMPGGLEGVEFDKPLIDRMEDTDLLIDSIVTDVRSAGLLTDDSARADALQFGHKSYMEFEAANTLVQALSSADPAALMLLKRFGPRQLIETYLPDESIGYIADFVRRHSEPALVVRNMIRVQRSLLGRMSGILILSGMFNLLRPKLPVLRRVRAFTSRMPIGKTQTRLLAISMLAAASTFLLDSSSSREDGSLNVWFLALMYGLLIAAVGTDPGLRRRFFRLSKMFAISSPESSVPDRFVHPQRRQSEFFVHLLTVARFEVADLVTLLPLLGLWPKQRLSRHWATVIEDFERGSAA